MKPVRAFVSDKKTGCFYYCFFNTTPEGFVVLKNVIQQKRIFINLPVFNNGSSTTDSLCQYYGVPCRDIMMPNERAFVQIISPEEENEWIDLREEDATQILETKKDEAKDKHDREKENFFKDKSDFEIFFLRLFGKI